MPGWFKKKHDRSSDQPQKRRQPLTLWLFYMGILCMSLTGVTFSRYSTVVHGTISVQVAAAYRVTFLDADRVTELASFRVYEGQRLTEVPNLNVCEAMLYDDSNMDSGDYIFSDEDTVYRLFLGWSLDGKTVIDPIGMVIDRDITFIAVYDILPEPTEVASPSDATPMDATPSNATLVEETQEEAVVERATPSNATPVDGV